MSRVFLKDLFRDLVSLSVLIGFVELDGITEVRLILGRRGLEPLVDIVDVVSQDLSINTEYLVF